MQDQSDNVSDGAPRKMRDGIVICDTLEEVKELYKNKEMMKGKTPHQKIEIT